jgi:hypothetical protein
MDDTNEMFRKQCAARKAPTVYSTTCSESTIGITDKRVAQLLLVLHELDESVAGLKEMPKSNLSELVSTAILACGFVDPMEARHAIATVLETIAATDSPLGYS